MLREASEQRKRLATILAFCSIPLSGFVTDIYLPSFPSMAKGLAVSEQDIQLTLTCYLLSYGISQIFVGSLLDNIGRYKPRLVALLILIITNLSITQMDSVFYICIMRIIQGMAISTLVVATRAIFIDIYDETKRQYYLSYFTIVWSCGPILAPFLGGYLEKLFNWHANFYFLAIYAGVLLILDLCISGESIPEKKRFNLSDTLSLYKMMLSEKRFMIGTLILGLSYSIVMIFNIAGPFLIENTFGYGSVVIGYCTLVLGFSWMLGGIIGKKRMHLDLKPKALKPSLVQLSLIAVLLITTIWIESLPLLIGFLFLIHICSGTLFNNFFTTTMLQFPNNAGTAGGLMGGLVYVLTSFVTLIISSTGAITTPTALGVRYLITAVALLLAILYIIKLYNREKQ
ncbi:MFS transporter [Myroides odoratimimus]|uniref:MFS transporter n=1 Tax=Myroides odoratimimus TaxID=76832 RepID=UPI001039AFC9|nr:MFS transporter [Myroides odoratimimus]MCA4791802.1 MFS transporter [Myroides odoratimimus]MCA4805653.1 MFS transporter [Myroides odoratimimus]MCA4819063.1 MFS transporter [Myroides odoratimimus]MDM1059170.1 MFS transporter [Myroides odoratimimus]MDM1091742.1 MFS transporter [Myroides odoratimimus]